MDHTAGSAPAALPPPHTKIRPPSGWLGLDWHAIWEYRELLYFMVWRDVKIRYKQTVLGAAWAVIQPAATVLLFTVIFGKFAQLPSDGMPYWIYAYCALLPWNLFSGVVNRSGGSLVSSAGLISKVYFPRLLVPLSAGLGALLDLVISLVVLLVLMLATGHVPGIQVLTLPLWLGLAFLLGTGVGVGLSALNVRFRDVSYLLTFMLQIWMYASPVAYSASIVPQQWRWLYQLNPLVPIIQGTRWALLGTSGNFGIPWIPGVAIIALLLTGALVYFNQVERAFADVV